MIGSITRARASWHNVVWGGVLAVGLLGLSACAGQKPAPSAQLKGVIKIAAGWTHSCALMAEGRVKCWGNNQDGQLGDGTRTPKRVPENVVGLLGTAKELALGERHTCVLTSAGAAKCWGGNHDAQLGDGTHADRVSPVEVASLPDGLRMIAAGEQHTCVLTAAGGVKCWGSNRDGQLGDGTTDARSKPVSVTGLDHGVAAIAAGWRHTCALTAAGGVKCWGNNKDGQVGDGTAVNRSAPVEVSGLSSGVTLLAAGGRHTCAGVAGTVKCWGHNERGQLGDGSTADKATPVPVVGLADISTLSAGWQHTCGLATGGGVKCWGNNEKGQTATGGDFVRLSPTAIMASPEKAPMAVGLAAGGQHTCILTADNVVQCRGDNEYGQLGEGMQAR